MAEKRPSGDAFWADCGLLAVRLAAEPAGGSHNGGALATSPPLPRCSPGCRRRTMTPFFFFFLLIKESFQLMSPALCCASTRCRICRLGLAPSLFLAASCFRLRRSLLDFCSAPLAGRREGMAVREEEEEGDNKGKQMNKEKEKRKIYIKHNCCHFTFHQVWWLAEQQRLSYFPHISSFLFPFSSVSSSKVIKLFLCHRQNCVKCVLRSAQDWGVRAVKFGTHKAL